MESTSRPKKKIQSSIPELTVGEERKLFNQIRKSAAYITPDTLLFNGWTAGGFALTYIIQHHMKRKRKAEEKTDPQSNKRGNVKTKAFEDPVTITSLEENLDDKPKPKKRVTKKSIATAPEPLELTRQTCSADELQFHEVGSVAEANAAIQENDIEKPKKRAQPKKRTSKDKEVEKEIVKKPRAPRKPKITTESLD